MSTPKTNKTRIDAAERRMLVLNMRKAGENYDTIVRAVEVDGVLRGWNVPKGYDRRYAYKDVMRELEKMRATTSEDAVAVRSLEIERLDKMLSGVWTSAVSGDDKAISSALRIMERRAKLLGLDEVVPMDLSGSIVFGVRGIDLDNDV